MQHTGILTTPKNSHKTGDLLSGDGLLFFYIFNFPSCLCSKTMIVTPVLCSDLIDRFQQYLHIQADILEDTIVQHSADLVGRLIAVDI